MHPKHSIRISSIVYLLLFSALTASPVSAQGLVLPAVGPVNQSMGGASVAAPLDSIGAFYWNPATIAGLSQSQMDFAVELLNTRTTVASAVGPGAFGLGLPAQGQAGSTAGNTGIYALPSFGVIYRPEESQATFGLGVLTIGGYGVNYPADRTNPVLSARPPNGLGVGAIDSQLVILELTPTVTYQLTDHLAIGGGPTVTTENLSADPALFAAPDDANHDGQFTYPSATHSRYFWGLGFQAGVYATLDSGWRFGASIRSNQWMQTLHFHAQDELGNGRDLRFQLDYPMILSLGMAYSGFDRLLLAADVRYLDYQNTPGFETSGFDTSGAARGLGWKSVFAVATGAQYCLTDNVQLRLGYTFNQNPIPGSVSFFNIASPALYEHIVYAGASLRLTGNFSLSLAYYHAFHFDITGPLESPAGPIPHTSVTNGAAIDALSAGLTVRF